MAAPTNTPLNADIWHLSIDDLFATLPDKARLGGPGPFVINLRVSTAPIELPSKNLGDGHGIHVYQVQRTEDRRLRHRLRLGPFSNEDDADAMLEKVRDIYPGALTATADTDDLRAISAAKPAAPIAVLQATPPGVAVPAASAAPAPSPAVVPPVLRDRIMPAPTEQRPLSVESTQTVRALTVLELENDQASRWFVIQLSLSEEPFQADAVPALDIFSAYRLYSVAGIDQGRIVHALRLGFFAEEAAAGAVASYLAEFYDQPSIKRVSAAERERFADQRFEPLKDIGATGRHAVIEITNERYVRERRTSAASPKNK